MNILKQLPDKCIDLVLTDPPYGINADIKQNKNAGKKGGKRGGCYKKYKTTEWDKNIPQKEYFTEIFRISKNQIIFGGEYMIDFLYPNRGWIIWDKVVRANYPDGEMAWSSFNKGLKIYSYSRADAYINDCVEKIHPTEKPLKLFEMILRDYSNENDIILDCFSGSGTTAIACHNLNRRFICIEKDYDYWKASVERLENAQAQMRLF